MLEAISAKPVLLLVVDDCHLYSNVPVSPLAAALLVNAAGVNGFVPLCAAAMVPPEVGLVQVEDDPEQKDKPPSQAAYTVLLVA